MSSRRHIEAGAPRARRIAVAFVTAFLLASLSGVAISGLAVADDAVKQTKHELREAKERVRARRAKIRDLQRRMNVLATRISKAEKEIGRTQAHIAELQKKMSALRARADLLQSKLDDRNRSAYMYGTAPVLYLLTATSAADAASRMAFINEMNRRDAVLAAHARITAAPRFHVRRGPDVRVELRPAIAGSEIVMERRVVTDDEPAGVRFVCDVDVVAMVELAPSCDQVPDLHAALVARAGPTELPAFLTALATAVARNWLLLVPESDSPARATHLEV